MATTQLASLRTRLLSMCYDGLIILFISTITVLLIQVAIVGGETIPPDHVLNKILKPFWFVPGFFYLAYYWTKKGQTPSMKVWKINIANKQGTNITWGQALIRYVTALLGLGIIWTLFNKDRLALQDILSGTSLIKNND